MKREAKLRIVRDLLLLVDSPVPLIVMREWGGNEVEAVEAWAVAAHLAASDNSVRVPPVPKCVRAFVRESIHSVAAAKTAASKAALAAFHRKMVRR